MERKIGEIFEYNREWYQCIEQPEKYDKTVCNLCDFHGIGNCELDRCSGTYRSDKKSVIFKKLEKVGEPYTDYCPSGRVIYFQRYKCYQKPAISKETIIHWADDISVSIEIKQTKEDMEDNKLNLKPFDLQKAREGKPVCTRDGRKVRIICFDSKNDPRRPIVALVEHNDNELLYEYTIEGKERFSHISTTGTSDLMMLPEKKEMWLNIYKGTTSPAPGNYLYNTEEEAKDAANYDNDYITTAKVCWGGIIMKLTQEILEKLYSDATRQTLDTLPEFIKHVMNDYELDYNTKADVVAICAIAGAHTADSCDKGGITGFQSIGVMWRFIFNWMYPNNRAGMRLINFDDMLYPQYENKFDKLISKRTFEELQEAAKEMIEKSKQSPGFSAPVVFEHWKSIVDGIVPFGYKLEENQLCG